MRVSICNIITRHLLTFDKMATLKFKERHDDLGPVIQIKMGVYTWIIINDPYIAHELFVKNGTVASNRPIDHGTTKYISNNKRYCIHIYIYIYICA